MAEHDELIAVILFLIILFSALLVVDSRGLMINQNKITGMAVLETKENVQTKIKEFVNKLDFLYSVEEASFCLLINMDAKTIYSYKVTKLSNVIDVTPSVETYCSGMENEDFIFSYVSYEKFLEHANGNPTFEDLKATAGGQNFYILPSKYIAYGMTSKNSEEFLEKYNQIFKKLSPAEQKQFLTPPEKREAAGMAFPMFFVYLGVGLILIVILLVIVLPKFTPKPAVEEILQLVTYIKSAIAKGYTEENIRDSLIGSGWDKETVEKAMQMAAQQAETTEETKEIEQMY